MGSTRTALTVLLVISGGAGAVWAQAQPPVTPAPSIGLPLPPIGLPLPPLGIPPAVDRATITPPDTPRRPATPGLVILGAAPHYWGFEAWQRAPVPGIVAVDPALAARNEAAAAAEEHSTGRLQIEVRPRDAQLFVDDDFVGTWSDLSGAIDLPPGSHRVEIRARGFESHAFDARVVAGRTITYRAELTPQRGAPRPDRRSPDAAADKPDAPIAVPAGAATKSDTGRTFYLIPGCYLGNIPPQEVKLPSGCDLSRMITHTPGKR